MMSKERRTLLITTFICLCSLLVYISFTAVYPEPKTVQQNLYSNMLFVGGIVINVVLNIVLNFKVCKTMGAKFLVKLGKWIMPFTSIFLVIVSIYSTIYPNSSFSNIATIVFVGLGNHAGTSENGISEKRSGLYYRHQPSAYERIKNRTGKDLCAG